MSCDLWLAVADQLHAHAVTAPVVLEAATSIIDTGLELQMKRSLGMDERDLAKRATVLDELRTKWAHTYPRPFKRKVQSTPDVFAFDVGDCAVYPVSKSGDTIDPYFAKAEDDRLWTPDGFGVMAVLGRGHRHLSLNCHRARR